MNFSTHLSVFNVICCYLYLFNILKIVSIFLSTQPQINTSVYPTIKISLFAAPKTQKIRGPGFTSKSSEKPYISSIFTLSIMYFSQQNHALNMPWGFTMNVNSFANSGFGIVHEFLLWGNQSTGMFIPVSWNLYDYLPIKRPRHLMLLL